MDKYPIESLVKHRRGMLLIDRLISHSDNGVVVEVDITPNSSFLQDGHVPAWIGVEYAAQGVAVYAGLRDHLNFRENKVGLLLSCRNYKVQRSRFMLGETLSIRVEEEFSDGQMGAYNCTIHDANQEMIASVSLNAYVPETVIDI